MKYQVANINEIEAVDCPCGKTRRVFADDPDRVASIHVVDVSADARTHYHKKMTEIYYVLEGTGEMELDGERFDIAAGSAILIKPGCRHRAIGKLKIINVTVPAFDPQDEWFDDEN